MRRRSGDVHIMDTGAVVTMGLRCNKDGERDVDMVCAQVGDIVAMPEIRRTRLVSMLGGRHA